MSKYDTKTLQAGQDVAWNDRLLQSDQSKAEGNQDVNLERGAAAEAFQKFTIAQDSHGFSVLDCVRHDGTDFVEATADSEANARVIGVVTEVIDTDNFVIQAAGRVTGASGLTGGSVHYLQDAGGLGTSAGTVEVPILLADSSSTGWLTPLGAGGGGGGGASNLDDLNDVDITSASEFDHLQHDGSTFVNVLPHTMKLVRNDTGSTISAGTLIEIHDANASTSRIRPADKDSSDSVDGIAAEEIGDNSEGVIKVDGTYDGVDTSGMTAGSALWLGDDGGFVDSPPTSGAVIRVAKVGIVHGSTGSIILNLPAFEGAESFVIACSDETTDLTTGTASVTFRMPYAFTVTDVRASVGTAPAGSAIQVDVNEAGSSILSTVVSIDAGDKTSEDSATQPVISDGAIADDAEVTIDVDQVGSSTAGAGLKVYLIGTQA